MNRPFWKLLRRFVVLVAFMFWQGGFLFYASVVVPIGTDVFGSAAEQGFVTQRVTQYLNLSGAVCLVLLAWDAWAGADCARWRRGLLWLLWMVMAATLATLACLHVRLDALLDPEYRIVLDGGFYQLHRVYLYTQTVQWAAAMIYAAIMLWAWHAEDVQNTTGERAT